MGWVDKWPSEHDALLRQVVAAGWSFSNAATKINAQFGTAYSRNACIGRAKRLGISGRKTVSAEGLQHRLIKKAEQKLKPPPVCQPIPAPRAVDVVPLNISLFELTDATCKWPYGDAAPYAFCGNPTWVGSSYCECHASLSIGPGTESERTADQGIAA